MNTVGYLVCLYILKNIFEIVGDFLEFNRLYITTVVFVLRETITNAAEKFSTDKLVSW